ncbi:MAG: hypothetical protein EOM54_06620 [Clostridia bacterium]|nr:hypothetical protein [Clostridia bacterium]
MSDKVLFEIPIYAYSEKVFNNRWKTKQEKMFKGMDEDIQRDFMALNYPRYVWKYNQIVGFIVISVNESDVLFDVYCSLDKKYFIDSNKKHFIANLNANGTHFYAGDKSETQVKQKIKEMLRFIKKYHLKPRFFVDDTAFNNLFEHVNVKQIMNSL